jgi:GH24 family phage-related lysozyme (muramidase)
MTEYDGLHPVFAERLKQLNEACGTWINSGYRSSDEQQVLYNRYLEGTGNPANPPGSSNHEAEPWGTPMALAADLAGDLDTANARAADFGLHFPIAATEPWHVQPIEIPLAYFTGIPAELGTIDVGAPALRQRARGQAVVDCQQRLNVHSITCDVDGDYGPMSEAAVVAFQQANGLEADGVVGPQTWAALDSDPAQPQPAPEPMATAGRLPAQHLRLSSQGAALLAEFEGKSNVLYNDPAGHCTIGIGHLVHHGPIDGSESEQPFADGLTDEQVYQLFLEQDAPTYESFVQNLVSVPLFPSEFDALTSFCFNVGGGALEESTLRERLNGGDYAGAADEFAKWVKAGDETLPGLVVRRQREADLFRSEWGSIAAPELVTA